MNLSQHWSDLRLNRPQTITWTNAECLSVTQLGTNFSEILIKMQALKSWKNCKMLSAKYKPYFPVHIVLITCVTDNTHKILRKVCDCVIYYEWSDGFGQFSFCLTTIKYNYVQYSGNGSSGTCPHENDVYHANDHPIQSCAGESMHMLSEIISSSNIYTP